MEMSWSVAELNPGVPVSWWFMLNVRFDSIVFQTWDLDRGFMLSSVINNTI